MKIISIIEIERAINFWRDKDAAEAVGGNSVVLTLGKEVRALSDAYGLMIFNQVTEIEDTHLTNVQRFALNAILSSGTN